MTMNPAPLPSRLQKHNQDCSDMPKSSKKKIARAEQSQTLRGWQQIASFLGHPAAVVQRWASEGMPVHREGRYVVSTAEELNAWLGKASGKPVSVATENTDLAAELKRGLAFIKKEKGVKSAKSLKRR
jgi:hypothetical protein